VSVHAASASKGTLTRLHASHRDPGSPADYALATIVDFLRADGYGLNIPAWDGDAYLRITNVLRAFTDLTVTSQDDVIWHYRSAQGSHVHPSRLTGIAIDLLDPDHTKAVPFLAPYRAKAIIHMAVNYVLLRYGFATALRQAHPCADAILTVTNPDQPTRGTIRITNDGRLEWHIRTPHHPDGGLTLPDIAATISRTLTRAQHPPTRKANDNEVLG
jgi:hypothetical protein